jgi:hypothetical protein
LQEEEIQVAKRKLQEEIDKAWRQVEETQQKEKEKKEKVRINQVNVRLIYNQVQELDRVIEKLKVQLESGSGWSPDQERQLLGLKKQREHLGR